MSKFKKWSDLEGMPISFDVNSTTEEAMQATDHPSRIHLTTDGRVVMNGVILGDRNPQRGKWDGRVVIDKAVPYYAHAGMVYLFPDTVVKFKMKNAKNIAEHLNKQPFKKFASVDVYHGSTHDGLLKEGADAESTVSELENTSPGLTKFYACWPKDTDDESYYRNGYVAIVRILKEDGCIFDEGKFSVKYVHAESANYPTTRPYHKVVRGSVIFTKPMQIHPNGDILPDKRLKMVVTVRKRNGYFNVSQNKYVRLKGSKLANRTLSLSRFKEARGYDYVISFKVKDNRGRISAIPSGRYRCYCNKGNWTTKNGVKYYLYMNRAIPYYLNKKAPMYI